MFYFTSTKLLKNKFNFEFLFFYSFFSIFLTSNSTLLSGTFSKNVDFNLFMVISIVFL